MVSKTCTLCSTIQCELSTLSTHVGCDFPVIHCPFCFSGKSFSSLLPPPVISESVVCPDEHGGFVFYPPSETTVRSKAGAIHLLADKDSVRTLLLSRPTHGFCAFLSTRTASGMHKWFQGASLVRQYDSSHPVSQALNSKDKKPSKVLAYYFLS